MTYRKQASLLALATALALPVASSADNLDFNYLELDYIDVDAGFSRSTTFEDSTQLRERTRSDGGYRLGAAWQFYENFHVFADYSSADQDLRVSFGDINATESFDVERLRVGVGYAFPLSNIGSIYGRLSYDRTEFDGSLVNTATPATILTNRDDDGLGVEVGALWAVTRAFQLQGQVRYSAVGEVDARKNDAFDDDYLFGVTGRWFFTPRLALQAGYETGEIDTWNVGARLTF
ncbi:MAG: outer membrane beta-barrel protein [Gammaproteobacteria bacterium]